MKRAQKGRWWSLYLLAPVAAGLLYVNATAHTTQAEHAALLIAIIVITCGLALFWAENHEDLIGSQGVDARAEEDSLAALGVEPGRYAPSLTSRQAHYRHALLAHAFDPEDSEH